MASPIPLELRRRVVAAYENGEGTYAEIAERFAVGEASVSRWLGLQRHKGSLLPAPMGGKRHEYRIQGEALECLKTMVEAVPDSSISELAAGLKESLELEVGHETVRLALKRLGLSKKKPSEGRQPRSERTCWRIDGPLSKK